MPLLFSYGTLQQPTVQLSTFGRPLSGDHDELPGFEPSLVAIDDPNLAAKLCRTHHANITSSQKANSSVAGTVFEITDAELARADVFEAAFSYARIAAILASGRETWVYVSR
ncbi:MAG: gamma-glutamylcyclotransferase family protein [Vicinamibacterales bacterium]